MIRPLLRSVFCGSLLLGATASAQTAPKPVETPTIRTTASEVLLDLVVRDKHGKPVKNLKPAEVQILEDGVAQPIKSFRYVSAEETQSTASAGIAISGTGATAAGPRSLRAVNLICIVLYGLDPSLRPRAIEAAQQFLSQQMPPETYVGLFILDDQLTPLYAFTKDSREMARAVSDAFQLRPLDFDRAAEAVLTANPTQQIIDTVTDTVAHTSTTTLRIAGGEISRTVITGAEVNTAQGANIMRGARVAENRDFADITGMRATDQILTMINLLGKLPGQKSVLLMCNGLVTTGDPDRFESILAKAKQMDLTVYAMDVAGLSHVSTSQAGDIALEQVAGVSRTQTQIGGSLSAAKEKSRQGDTMNLAVRGSDSQAALRALSEGTGGFLIANTNEFKKPFQRIVDDLEVHYEVTYHPASETYDGRLRTIQVKVSRPDVRVESRNGYFAMPELPGSRPLAPFEVLGLALLNTKPRPEAFDFRVGSLEFRNQHAVLVFQLPGSSLSAAPRPGGGSFEVHPSLFALVKDSGGQVVDQYSVDAPYEVPSANVEALKAADVTYTHPLTLNPGRYSVETAIIDRAGGRASTKAASFEVSGSQSGLGMSSAMLVQNLQHADHPDASDPLVVKNKKLVPFMGASLKPDANPYVYFVVYPEPGNQAKPRLQVQFLVGTAELANQTSDLPAPDASGAIPMIIRAAKHPGVCELRITASQGSSSVTRSIHYTVEP